MILMKNVSSKYGSKTVLRDVSFSIKRGEAWVLFGPDDAGKTTLLQLLMGYNISYRGQLALMGCRPNWMNRQQREKVRYVPDDLLWEAGVTGGEFLRRALAATARYNLGIQEKLCAYFEVPLEQELLKMSGQDNKLIQIIAALAAVPEVLILDEPMNFLDRDVWGRVLDRIRTFQKAGMTVLITAEEYEDVLGQCDHYAYLRDGCLIMGAVGQDTGGARLVNAVRNDSNQSGIYRGKAAKLQGLLMRAGYQDWEIESLTLREELDMIYGSKN